MNDLALGDLILVDWRDSSSIGEGWQSVEHAIYLVDQMLAQSDVRHEQTAGFFIHANDGYLVLALNYTPGTDSALAVVDGVIAIPHPAIRSIRRLMVDDAAGQS